MGEARYPVESAAHPPTVLVDALRLSTLQVSLPSPARGEGVHT